MTPYKTQSREEYPTEQRCRGRESTIVAVATAVGLGAIGIVRLSGPAAVEIAGEVFRPARGCEIGCDESHVLLYGHVVDARNGAVVDEALLAVMRGPRTYTREDVVEIQCHGGLAAQRAVLRLVLQHGGRLAEPGEFTRRAFENGRIDLAQAESVAAIVSARSTAALRASVRQLEGGLSDKLRAVRMELVRLLALIEASLDFSDEDVDDVDWSRVTSGLEGVELALVTLLRTALVGRVLEQGVRTAIVGKPNVGKSSLLNALLMRERAIVSDIPGTTRDTVEELVEIGGMPIHLVDTAGLRHDGDVVEQLGVARSVKEMEQADVVLAVVDLSEPADEVEERLLRSVDAGRTIVVGNKCDLVRDRRQGAARVEGVVRRVVGAAKGGTSVEARLCTVSAKTGEGLDELRKLVESVATGGEGLGLEEPVLAAERHRVLVSEALASTRAALGGAGHGRAEELVCEDLREATRALGSITGEELTADLLDEIFSRFCIGK